MLARAARRSRRAIRWSKLLGGALAASAVWRFGPTWKGVAACVFLWTLLALTFIDFDTQLLPDDLTLPLLWAGLLANLFGLFVPLHDAVIGAIAGYLALWIVYWLFKLIRGKEGMGYGDFKLLAALGAWLGWQMLPLIVLLSSVVGAVDRHRADRVQGPRPQHSAGVRTLPRDRRRRSRCSSARTLIKGCFPADAALRRRPHRRHRQRQVGGGARDSPRAAPTSLDADDVAHALTAPRRSRAIAPSSPPSAHRFVGADGELDRAWLRERAFADAGVPRAPRGSCCIR